MPRFKDQALCIREIDWSETSQVVVLLTAEHGKVRGLAKGARRSSPSHLQRFAGGINLLNLGQVVATTRRTAQLATITEWDLGRDYFHLRRDLAAQRLAMYAADLAGAFTPELDARPDTFYALAALLDRLKEPTGREATLLAFQWAVINEGGFQPELTRDVRRGDELPDQREYGFDPAAGGFTIEATGPAWRVRRRTVELLRSVARGEPIDGQGYAEPDLRRANRLLCVYARAILERELPTMRLVLGEG